MSNSHQCQALVVHCIDFRFVDMQKDFLANKGLEGSYDLLTVPGAAKNVHRLEEWIDLALKLHSPKEILIMDHEDCGGYGADNSFETHKTHLLQAKKDLEAKYPVQVTTFLSTFEGIKEVS